jgi:hypothetical protein
VKWDRYTQEHLKPGPLDQFSQNFQITDQWTFFCLKYVGKNTYQDVREVQWPPRCSRWKHSRLVSLRPVTSAASRMNTVTKKVESVSSVIPIVLFPTQEVTLIQWTDFHETWYGRTQYCWSLYTARYCLQVVTWPQPLLHNVQCKLKLVNLSLRLIKHRSMKTYGGVEVQLPAFLTSALDRGEWSALRPGRLVPIPTGRAPGPVWTRWRR